MTVELEPELEDRIRRIAADSQVSEDFVVREALERFLRDREDYAAGIRSLSRMKYTISQEEMERLSNVAD